MSAPQPLVTALLTAATWATAVRAQDDEAAQRRVEALARGPATEVSVAAAWRLHAELPRPTTPLGHYWRSQLLRFVAGYVRRTSASGYPSELELRRAAKDFALESESAAVVGDAWLLLGRAAQDSGRRALATAAFTAVVDADGNGTNAGVASVQLARLALFDGRLDATREHVATAKRLEPTDESAWARSVRADVRGALADYHRRLGELATAADRLREERELLGADHPTARLRQLDWWLAAEQFEPVVTHTAQWLEEASSTDSPWAETVRLGRGIGLYRTGESDRAVALFERLSRSSRVGVANAARLRLATASLDRGDAGAARDRVAELVGERSFALRISALRIEARLALAAEGPPEPELLDRLTSAVDGLLAQWDESESRPEGLGFLQLANRRDLLSLLIRVQLRSNADPATAFATLLAVARRGAFARRLEVDSLDLEHVLAEFGADDVGAVWLPANVGSHLFLLADGIVRHFDVAPEPEVRRVAASFRALAIDPSCASDEVRRIGGRLRKLLFPADAWEVVASRGRVTLFGSDVWGRLPFEALPSSTHEYFGHTHAVVHVASVAVGAWGRGTVVSPIDSVVVSTAARPHPRVAARYGLETLEFDDGDLDALFESWSIEPERAELGALAAPDATPTYELVLAHGIYAAHRPRPVGLATGHEPGVVWTSAFERRRSAPLTTVLACEAGRSPRHRGEDGGAGLAAALMWSGAQTVVLADESLELASSLELVRLLHEEMRDRSVAEALRRARVRLAADPAFAAPAYHCLLKVTGRGDFRAIVPRARSAPGGGVPIAALLIVFAGIVWLRVVRRRS